MLARVRLLTRSHPLASILCLALLVRFALTPLYAYLPNGLLDEGFWKHWMEAIDRDGVLNIFRTTDTDYVGYHWLLWPLSIVYGWIGGPYDQHTPSLHILVKMPSIAFDIALILVVYHAAKALVASERPATSGLPLVAAAVIAFHPAVLYDSAVWAQTDSAITAAMLGAILLASRRRPALAGASLAFGFAVKPHPVIVAPMLTLALLRRGGIRAVVLAGAAAALVMAAVLLPWVLHGDLARILDVYGLLFTKNHDRLSELAWNVWWIFDFAGDPRPGTAIFSSFPLLTYRVAGLALSGLAAALALAYAWSRPGLYGALVAAAYQAFAFHALPIAAHERYLYPFLALLLPVALLERRWLWLYIPVSATFFLNLVVVAPPVAELMDRWVYGEFGVAVAVANVALFAAFTAVLLFSVAQRRLHLAPGHDVAEEERADSVAPANR
jgi:Gpi18-like mannosyltransferase